MDLAHLTLAEQYRLACDTPSDIVLHLPRFVEMVAELDARHVIELGSRSGVSTVAWLYGIQATGGRLTSVDLAPAPEIGVWPEWRHIQGNDLAVDVLAQLEPADIVFIDTSHTYPQTKAELATYRSLARRRIVLHDTMLRWPEGADPSDGSFPVQRAVREFVAEHGYRWHNFPDCYGLGVIEVD